MNHHTNTEQHEFGARRQESGRGRPRRGGPHRGGGHRRRGEGRLENWGEMRLDVRGQGRDGGRGRGPGRGRRGDVRNAILALIAEEPMNGYQIIKAVSERSDGLWRPGPGSVYPALGLLEDEGLIQPAETGQTSKKVYELTEAGTAYVKEHSEELSNPWEQITGPQEGFLDLRRELSQLGMAMQQVAVAGDEKQIAAAKALLSETRRSAYRILAGDEDGSTQTDSE